MRMVGDYGAWLPGVRRGHAMGVMGVMGGMRGMGVMGGMGGMRGMGVMGCLRGLGAIVGG